MKICNCCNTPKDNTQFPKWKRNCIDCQHLKYCPTCKEVKDIECFTVNTKGRCKKCFNKLNEIRKTKNKTKYLEKMKLKQRKRNLKLKELRLLNKPVIDKAHSENLLRLRRSIHSIFKKWQLNKIKKSYDYLFFTKEEFLNKFPIIDKKEDIDHKVPLSWFKKETPIGLIFDLENLQLLDRKENQTKCNYYASPISDLYYRRILSYVSEEYIEKLKIN